MGSYYAKNMIHATYVWVLMILNMYVLIECSYGFNMEMDASILI
jgi:hypothetical protein